MTNPTILYILDSGSSENMASSALLERLYPNYKALLTPYKGPSVLSCTKSPLVILGVLHSVLTIGPYSRDDHFQIYKCQFEEFLLGLRTIREQEFIATGYNLLIPTNRLYPLNDDKRHCNRSGPDTEHLFDMQLCTDVMIALYSAEMVQHMLSPGQALPNHLKGHLGLPLGTQGQSAALAVVHSEDYQQCTPSQIADQDMATLY